MPEPSAPDDPQIESREPLSANIEVDAVGNAHRLNSLTVFDSALDQRNAESVPDTFRVSIGLSMWRPYRLLLERISDRFAARLEAAPARVPDAPSLMPKYPMDIATG